MMRGDPTRNLRQHDHSYSHASLRISEFAGGINADMLSARVKDPQLKRWGSGDPQRPSENDNDSLKAPTTISKNPNNHPQDSQQLSEERERS